MSKLSYNNCILGSKHHVAALDGVVLAFDVQGHALAAAREELLEGFFGTGRNWRIKALDRLKARDAHLDGIRLRKVLFMIAAIRDIPQEHPQLVVIHDVLVPTAALPVCHTIIPFQLSALFGHSFLL